MYNLLYSYSLLLQVFSQNSVYSLEVFWLPWSEWIRNLVGQFQAMIKLPFVVSIGQDLQLYCSLLYCFLFLETEHNRISVFFYLWTVNRPYYNLYAQDIRWHSFSHLHLCEWQVLIQWTLFFPKSLKHIKILTFTSSFNTTMWFQVFIS